MAILQSAGSGKCRAHHACHCAGPEGIDAAAAGLQFNICNESNDALPLSLVQRQWHSLRGTLQQKGGQSVQQLP